MAGAAVIACLLCALVARAAGGSSEWNTAALDGGKFVLNWMVEGNKNIITFSIEAESSGWVGVGFSANGAMTKADMAIAWITHDGRPHVSDRIGPEQGNGFPLEDAVQNYKVIHGHRNDTHITVSFSREMDTCDKDEDRKITPDTVRLLWAYGEMAPGDSFQYHGGNRGARSINLFYQSSNKRMEEIYSNPDDYMSIDLMVNDIEVPSTHDTMYWCKFFKLPDWTDKHHMVAYDMIVQEGSEEHVHHALLYLCVQNMSAYMGDGQMCYGPSGKAQMDSCGEQFLAGWSVGGEQYSYPDNMGYPLFDNGQRYLFMEVHYDNSRFRQGVRDSSGMRLYLTRQLRQTEVGGMKIMYDVSPSQTIPPRQPRFTTYVYVPAECTARFNHSYFIISGLLHAHTTDYVPYRHHLVSGVALRLRHIRKGVELAPIFRDESYDFDYQSIVNLREAVEVKPGDELILECDYNTMHRDTVTVGDFGTSGEMCLALLNYYPKNPYASGGMVTQMQSLPKQFGVLGARHVQTAPQLGNVTLADGSTLDWKRWLNGLAWHEKMVSDWHKFSRYGPRLTVCVVADKPIEVDHMEAVAMITTYGPPDVVQTYRENDTACKSEPVGQVTPDEGTPRQSGVILIRNWTVTAIWLAVCACLVA